MKDERITVPIARIVRESPSVKTFYFDVDIPADPGQFVMLTDFVHGEKPFSISSRTNGSFSVTLRAVGPFTEALCAMTEGDIVSIRGAFGSSFFTREGAPGGERILLAGGGCGTPPLHFLASELIRNGNTVTLVNGSRSADEILFSDTFRRIRVEVIETSEDGLLPHSGTVVDAADELLAVRSFDRAYAAGPELMMRALVPVFDTAGLPFAFLLERYMKCGIGICGSCTLDPEGIRLCVEGPVIDGSRLARLIEFGTYRRDAAGRRRGFSGCA